jgi:hypothetical protein
MRAYIDRSTSGRDAREANMLGLLSIVVLVLALICVVPAWPYNKSWGYYPTGGMGIILALVVVLLLMGRI